MKIPSILQPLIDPARQPVPTLLSQLKIGQVLHGKVTAQLQPGLMRLQIGNTALLARSEVRVEPGSRLQLEVVKPMPLPELRILRRPDPATWQQRLVRSAIGRQLPPAEVRQQLNVLRTANANPRETALVRQFVDLLQQRAISGVRIEPAQLQQAIARSGLTHEARLATQIAAVAAARIPAATPVPVSSPPLPPVAGEPTGARAPTPAGIVSPPVTGAAPLVDVKLQLLQLLERLQQVTLPAADTKPRVTDASAQRPDPAGDSLLLRLMRLVEGSVNRIQLHQAVALPVEEGPRQAWQLDLPLQVGDETHDLMLRIERDNRGDTADQDPAWAVNLVFQFDSIGTLQTRIALAGDRLSATFWSDRPATHTMLEARLPKLATALEAQGFEIVHLAGVLGEPSEPLISLPVSEKLLDERA